MQDDDDRDGKGITEEMRLKSMESLIAEMQRQQKIYDLAKAIVTGGIGAVEKFVPGLSAASAGTKTIFAFVEALQKGRQLLDWFRNQADAKVAVTVQYEVMMNRYGLAAEQAVVAGVQALTAAIDRVGKAMQLARALAPVGIAISAAATITENSMDIMVKVPRRPGCARLGPFTRERLPIRKIARPPVKRSAPIRRWRNTPSSGGLWSMATGLPGRRS